MSQSNIYEKEEHQMIGTEFRKVDGTSFTYDEIKRIMTEAVYNSDEFRQKGMAVRLDDYTFVTVKDHTTYLIAKVIKTGLSESEKTNDIFCSYFVWDLNKGKAIPCSSPEHEDVIAVMKATKSMVKEE